MMRRCERTPTIFRFMKMSSADIASKNKGIGVEIVTYLKDGLWRMNPDLLSLN